MLLWWSLIVFGGAMIALALFNVASLRLPAIGPMWLGDLWPGRFGDHQRRRHATRVVLMRATGWTLWGVGWMVEALTDGVSLQDSPYDNANLILMFLGLVAFSIAFWGHRTLRRTN